MSNTFGLEAEFESNVESLVARLHRDGLTYDSTLHGYHCRCEEACDFDNGFVFRGQTDSSCGGEVISHVFRTEAWDEARDAMLRLQEAAVEVDAEPSLRAGFHVHVGNRPIRLHQTDTLWAYLRWEAVLGEVAAAGRFEAVRPFNHRLTSELCDIYLEGLCDDFEHAPFSLNRSTGAWTQEFRPDVLAEVCDDPHLINAVKQATLEFVMEGDRHGWVNLATRGHRTWEFRLWNATRSAWRMEMFARLSLLMVNPGALNELLTATPSAERLVTLAGHYDEDLAALLERQANGPRTNGPFSLLTAAA